MKLRKSYLNGRLENEVEDFIACLENEFDMDVESLSVQFINPDTEEKILHVFSVCQKNSSYCEV